jgi:D-alanyl-D-alanine carboxypeptidase
MIQFENKYFELDNKRLVNLGMLLVLILGFLFLTSLYASRGVRVNDKSQLAKNDLTNPFETVQIEALSAVVLDLNSGKVIFEKNSNEPRPLASITKIMTALTATDILPAGTVVTVDKRFISEEGDSGLYSNEKWRLQDLLDFSLVSSSNDGIAAIAGAAGSIIDLSSDNIEINHEDFISKMNEKAKEIGLVNSHFFNETGLDIDLERSGGYSSALDTAQLFGYVLKNHPEIFEATRYNNIQIKSLSSLNHKAPNTNTDTVNIPGLLASKTGYTEMAGGNLAIVFDPGIARPIAIVVLGSSYDGRFKDVSILTQKTFEYLAQGN